MHRTESLSAMGPPSQGNGQKRMEELGWQQCDFRFDLFLV